MRQHGPKQSAGLSRPTLLILVVGCVALTLSGILLLGRQAAVAAAEEFIDDHAAREETRFVIHAVRFCWHDRVTIGWRVDFTHPVHGRQSLIIDDRPEEFGAIMVGTPELFWSYLPGEKTIVRF